MLSKRVSQFKIPGKLLYIIYQSTRRHTSKYNVLNGTSMRTTNITIIIISVNYFQKIKIEDA